MANGYPLAFAVCKPLRSGGAGLGHAWIVQSWAGNTRESVCTCGTVKRENFDSEMQRDGRPHYNYPKGYLRAALTDVEAAKFRLETRRRLISTKGIRWVTAAEGARRVRATRETPV